MKKFNSFRKSTDSIQEPILIDAIPMHGEHSKPNTKKKSKKSSDLKEETKPTSDWPSKDHPTGEGNDVKSWLQHNPNSHLGHDVESIHAHLTKTNTEPNFNSYSSEEKNGLNDYTGHSYNENTHLIKSAKHKFEVHGNDYDKNKVKEKIKSIDSALNKTKLPHDLHVYHGTSRWNPGEEAKKHPEGLIRLPAYTSTSISKGKAHSWSNGDSSGEEPAHVLHIHAKKGTHGVYIGDKSQHSSEREFLLHRNTVLKVHPTPTHSKNSYGKPVYIWHAKVAVSKPQDYERDSKLYNNNKNIQSSLERAMKSDSSELKASALSHPKIPEHYLDHAIQYGDYHEKAAAVSNPAVDSKKLSDLYHNSHDLNIRDTILKNPKIDKSIIDDILKDKFEYSKTQNIIHNPNLTHDQLSKLLKHSDSYIRNNAIRHKNIDENHIKDVLNSPDSSLRSRALRHEKLSDQELEKTIKNNNPDDLESLIHNPKITKEHIDEIIKNNGEKVPAPIYSNEKIDPKNLDDLFMKPGNHYAKEYASMNRKLSSDTIHKIISNHQDQDSQVLSNITEVPNFNGSHIHAAIHSKNYDLIKRALKSHHVNAEHLVSAFNSDDDRIKLAALRNNNIPDHIVKQAFKSDNQNILGTALEHHGNKIDKNQFDDLMKKGSDFIKSELISKLPKHLDIDQIHSILNSDNSSFYDKSNAIKSPNFNADHVDSIFKNYDKNTVDSLLDSDKSNLITSKHIDKVVNKIKENPYNGIYHLLSHPAINSKHLEKIANNSNSVYDMIKAINHHKSNSKVLSNALKNKNSDDEVARAVFSSPHVDKSHVDDAIKSENSYIRREAARSKIIEPEQLDKLLHDSDYKVQQSAITNPKIKKSQLYRLSKHVNDDIRVAVARNKNTPRMALSNLVNDPNKYIRQTVANHENLSPEHINALIKNGSDNESLGYHRNATPENLRNIVKKSIQTRDSYGLRAALNNKNADNSVFNLAKKLDKNSKYSHYIDQALATKTMNEEAPVNAVGSGNIAGIGVGEFGKPGIKPAVATKYKRKNKKEAPKSLIWNPIMRRFSDYRKEK